MRARFPWRLRRRPPLKNRSYLQAYEAEVILAHIVALTHGNPERWVSMIDLMVDKPDRYDAKHLKTALNRMAGWGRGKHNTTVPRTIRRKARMTRFGRPHYAVREDLPERRAA